MQYTEEFKIEAVRRLGIPVVTLDNWMHRRRVAAPVEAGAAVPTSISLPAAGFEAKVSRLGRELPSAKLDIKILRKATAHFVKGSQ
jgi:transposase